MASNGWCQVINEQGVITEEVLNLKNGFISAALAAYPDATAGDDLVEDLPTGSTIPGWSSFVTV